MMRNVLKAGLLIILLVVPASVFLLLKGFGQNHYTLKTYYPVVDSTTGQVVINKRTQYNQNISDTLFHTVPGFNLIDQHGKNATETISTNKIYVANFFFTRCNSICPKMSSELSRVQDFFLDNADIVIVSYSVDPQHDSVSVLNKYATQYNAKPGKWYLLTGEKQNIYKLAETGYKIPVVDLGKQTQTIENAFVHSEKLILVDKAKHIRGYYDGTDPKDVDRLILEIQILLSGDAN
ncbi:MAG: SCO family protein [Bacteroidota bacterium]